jgi:hypothetical protein
MTTPWMFQTVQTSRCASTDRLIVPNPLTSSEGRSTVDDNGFPVDVTCIV